ncbi:hypothetical protein JAAARDRAFT_579445 [Jaapia argillacea MUCL 33604]|uniref:Uncharacterized protein n=1 Tax=Jaapia argillacea MUCL 33604 TaxID=933084 RepID=A0A067Q594_9AGAM|nr:hypothetical protein JAAARDRAFT_579445 [Jaapia argillacea MUCL 33604]
MNETMLANFYTITTLLRGEPLPHNQIVLTDNTNRSSQEDYTPLRTCLSPPEPIQMPAKATGDPGLNGPASQESQPIGNPKVIDLAKITVDGVEIQFDLALLPEPPAVSFSDNMSELFREWSKSEKGYLTISGHKIPICQWDLYKCRRRGGICKDSRYWSKLRASWHNWKYVVEEFQKYPSEDTFHDAFVTSTGKRMCYSQILDRITKAKETGRSQFKADAEAARTFFGGQLDDPKAMGKFQYKKSGKWRIRSTDEQVAMAWRVLLEENEDIKLEWELRRILSAAES